MRYPFKMYIMVVEDHKFWVAESETLKGCIGQGDTGDIAISELETNEVEWLNTAAECDIPIPEVPIIEEQKFSGKFTVRISPTVHKEASRQAEIQGISLNQYVNDAIVAQNSNYKVSQCVKEVIQPLIDSVKHFVDPIKTEPIIQSTLSIVQDYNPSPKMVGAFFNIQ